MRYLELLVHDIKKTINLALFEQYEDKYLRSLETQRAKALDKLKHRGLLNYLKTLHI